MAPSAPRLRRKLRKGAFTVYIKDIIENNGGTFLFINWKKRVVHLLTKTKNKKVLSLGKYGIYGR